MISPLPWPALRPEAATTLDLPGLAADNLLAFLALLGLLRALDATRPDWRPRVSWSGPPWLARLHLAADVDRPAAAATADDGVRQLGAAHDLGGRKNIDFTAAEFRALAETAARAASPTDRRAADLLAALASETNLKGANGRVEGTALCAIHGQGHQNFLERLDKLGRTELERGDGARAIEAALFEPWRYAELGLTFRWDPEEDRRYALGHADPGSQKIRTVPGANRLAAVGFMLCPCMPTAGRLHTTGFRRQERRVTLTWPLWTLPLSLAAVRTLLGHPALVQDLPERHALAPYGVAELMRVRRIQTGKYLSFEPARPLWGG